MNTALDRSKVSAVDILDLLLEIAVIVFARTLATGFAVLDPRFHKLIVRERFRFVRGQNVQNVGDIITLFIIQKLRLNDSRHDDE